MSKSIGTTRCHVVCDSGVTSRNSSEVGRAIHSPNSAMEISPSNVPLVLIQDETYLTAGTPMMHARELSPMPHKPSTLIGAHTGGFIPYFWR